MVSIANHNPSPHGCSPAHWPCLSLLPSLCFGDEVLRTSPHATLTKDNMLRKKWKGNTKCPFCNENETINHLFFECEVIKYVWSMVALVLGANCRPENIEQYLVWIQNYMPNGKKFHMVGLAGICWAIWKIRNKVCFDKKIVRSPTEIICYACSFLKYWSGLQRDEDGRALEEGAEVLQQAVIQHHPRQRIRSNDVARGAITNG
ncbi:hypothetical protein EJB05_05514, partial [Eragrostis curvula]